MAEAETLPRLLARRAANRGVVTRSFNTIDTYRNDDDIEDETKVTLIEAQLAIVQNKLGDLEEIDRRIQSLTADDALENVITENLQYQHQQETTRSLVAAFCDSIRPEPEDDDDADTHVTGRTEYRSIPDRGTPRYRKLAKLELPTFDGDIFQWRSFWDAFTSEIDDDPDMPEVTKFNFLRAQLRKDAYNSIRGYRVTKENYPKAVAYLEERYGSTNKIVAAHFKALYALPHANDGFQSLRSFYDSLEGHVRSLEALGKKTESYGALLVCSLLEKLTINIRRNIARSQGDKEWTLDALRKALKTEVDIMEVSQLPSLRNADEPSGSSKNFTVLSNADGGSQSNSRGCQLCKDDGHKPADCSKYPSTDDRFKAAQRLKLCFNCLSSAHRSDNCTSKRSCNRCKKKHHTALHDDNRHGGAKPKKSAPNNPAPTSVAQSSPQVNSATFTRSSTSSSAENKASENVSSNVVSSNEVEDSLVLSNSLSISPILLKTAIAPVTYDEDIMDANMLLDDCSHRTFITIAFWRDMSLPDLGYETLSLSPFGSDPTPPRTYKVTQFYIILQDGGRILVKALLIDHITNPIHRRLDVNVDEVFPQLKGLKLAHPVGGSPVFAIDILIGADYYYEIIQNKSIRGATGPIAWESRLGYLLCGPTGAKSTSSSHASSLVIHADESFDLSKFWMTEALGVLPEQTKEEWVSEYKEKKVSFRDGKYWALLPWKEEHPPLKSNLPLCQARTRVMVKRMLQKNPTVMDTYCKIIQDQLDKGFIEVVKEDSVPKSSVHYICHHPVLKESFTTPVRIVYDCSCKTSDGVSLNDCLEEGPPLQNDMLHLYIRFRMHKFALMSDIEKAFHMIQLDPTERDYFRFLFPSNPKEPSSPFITYRFCVFPFGANCSPFVLHAVVQKHLQQHESAVSLDLQRNIYVDNLIHGCSKEEEAVKFYMEAKTILSSGGFNLREWTTNDPSVYQKINQDRPYEERPTLKVLGLEWNRMDDKLGFPLFRHPAIARSTATKRRCERHSFRFRPARLPVTSYGSCQDPLPTVMA